jgi:hypothetical protein
LPLSARPTNCSRSGIDYWLFGGWAVEFHAGSITRPHDDIDFAIWLDDRDRIVRLLEAEGWKHAPYVDDDGGTGYERAGVRLELTFLVPGEGGGGLHPVAFGSCRLVGQAPEWQGDGVLRLVCPCPRARRAEAQQVTYPRRRPIDAAKDRADLAALSQLP